MLIPVFNAILDETGLKYMEPIKMQRYLQTLAGKRPIKVNITIEKQYKRRSTGKPTDTGNQNGYYWKVVIPMLSDHFGYDPDEMHHAIKTKFLRIGGTDELPKVKSSAKLTTIEFEDLMEEIRIWALAEFNILIPTIDDYYSGVFSR